MEISYDAEKRSWTLRERGLDFADAVQVFAGTTLTIQDDRRDYGETRFQTMGRLGDRLVMLVWTPRHGAWHIISMRKANDREQKKFDAQLE
ncbi:MAG: BrnT family toxin [Sphingomonas sp.]|uniref:BrnT family toxin n=1 Tax=Sphingomonas sp. TaxID=28214 RepID=UPI0017C86BE3|nr:BrnT family toxin [Sphingomonas sp.]MBA3668212.1 BrnT family toxin [Sphingomonas sp.]